MSPRAPSVDSRSDVKSAYRVVEIVEALAQSNGGLSFAQLVEHLGYPRSSLHGLVRTLLAAGWLEFDEEGRRYRLALRMWELGQTYMRAADLATRARPFMQQVTAELEETTQLAILDGRYNVYIAKVDGPQPLVLASQVGRRLEAHATGLGKVLLAWLSPDELLVRIGDTPLERLTKSTITSVPRLQAELAVIRQRGYGIDNEEYTLGVRCVAFPVRNHLDEVVAAMSVSVPTARYRSASEARTISVLKANAIALSRALGHVPSRVDSKSGLVAGGR